MTYLPEVYREFMQHFPDVGEAYEDLADRSHNWGPLGEKERRLVKLGIAMGLGSEGAVKSHVRRALEEDVTPEEIRHAVLMALTTAGFPAMIAALKWTEEVLSKHKVVSRT